MELTGQNRSPSGLIPRTHKNQDKEREERRLSYVPVVTSRGASGFDPRDGDAANPAVITVTTTCAKSKVSQGSLDHYPEGFPGNTIFRR